jgi:hypothetical protein
MSDEKQDKPAFTVVDRRTAGRDVPDEAPQQPGAAATDEAAAKTEAAKPEPGKPEAAKAEAEKKAPRAAPPPIDFTTFLVSLASTAMVQLGVEPDPVSGKAEPDPVLARQTIDILGMLREKTRGNLTDDETRLYDALLYDLRMRYVQVAGRGA